MKTKIDSSPSIKSLILKNSLYLWVGLTLINIIFIAISWHMDEKWLAVGLISFLLQLYLTHQTLNSIKDLGKGYWGRVFVGLSVSAIAGFGLIFSGLATNGWIFPDYTNELREVNEELLIESNRDEQEIEQLLEVYDDPSVDIVLASAWFLKTAFVGLVISLILAAIIKDD